jgi:hypothetical protein
LLLTISTHKTQDLHTSHGSDTNVESLGSSRLDLMTGTLNLCKERVHVCCVRERSRGKDDVPSPCEEEPEAVAMLATAARR